METPEWGGRAALPGRALLCVFLPSARCSAAVFVPGPARFSDPLCCAGGPSGASLLGHVLPTVFLLAA